MTIANSELRSLVTPQFINKRLYTDEAIFKLEMERIYGKLWLFVAHESQLKKSGDFARARMGLQDVIVVRDADGNVNVLENRCAHRGSTLCNEQRGNTRSFVCNYHGWNFGLDGTLDAVPYRASYPSTFVMSDKENSLRRVPRVESYRGFVFASLDQDVESLESFLGPMRGALDNLIDRSPTGEIEMSDACFRLEYHANWKMHHENANDTIHPGVVHQSSITTARRHQAPASDFDFGQTREMLQANGFGIKEWEGIDLYAFPHGHSYMGGIYKSGLLARKVDDPVHNRYMETMTAAYGKERADEIVNLDRFNNLIYPNLNINAQYHQLRIVHPIASDRTMVISYCFRLLGAPDEIYRRAVRFLTNLGSPASMIYGDDADIFERCNAGLHGSVGDDWINTRRGEGFDQPADDGGVVAFATEAPIRAQYGAWLKLMTTENRERV